MTSVSCDVAIVGGGPVGAALAILLARQGLRIVIVEGRELQPHEPQAWDSRVFAISPGSRALLRVLGVWQRIATERVAAIAGMRVWGDDDESTIGFDALEVGSEDLGAIVEAGRLQMALWDAMRAEPEIDLRCPIRCGALRLNDGGGALTLSDGAEIQTALLVGADGAESWLRGAAGLTATAKPYAQTAVVANFATERAHGNVARQWFRGDGVLAWLPLPGDRISIVWSAENAVAEELLALTSTALCERVAEAGGGALGRFELLGSPASFPLRMVSVPRAVGQCVALVGDAAHVVHPLAGQGINVGFRDVVALSEALRGRGRHEGAGDLVVLRRYERSRREDWLATRIVTDGLQRLFHADRRDVAIVRNLGLALAERLPELKRRLMAQAMQ